MDAILHHTLPPILFTRIRLRLAPDRRLLCEAVWGCPVPDCTASPPPTLTHSTHPDSSTNGTWSKASLCSSFRVSCTAPSQPTHSTHPDSSTTGTWSKASLCSSLRVSWMLTSGCTVSGAFRFNALTLRFHHLHKECGKIIEHSACVAK